MKNAYVIMKKQCSPIFITEARPHQVVTDRKKAIRLTDQLNDRATNNEYWFERVPVVEE